MSRSASRCDSGRSHRAAHRNEPGTWIRRGGLRRQTDSDSHCGPDPNAPSDPAGNARRFQGLELRHHPVPVPCLVGRFDRLDGVALPRFNRRAGRRGGGGLRRRGRGKCWAISRSRPPARGRRGFDHIHLFESTFCLRCRRHQGLASVEPARCSVPCSSSAVSHYGHHPSVIGFGVDVEWYRRDLARFGNPVTDAEARDWVASDAGRVGRSL